MASAAPSSSSSSNGGTVVHVPPGPVAEEAEEENFDGYGANEDVEYDRYGKQYIIMPSSSLVSKVRLSYVSIFLYVTLP